MNGICYSVWKEKKIALEGTHLRNEQYGLTAISLLILVIVLILSLGFDIAENIEVCLLIGLLLCSNTSI